MRISFALQPAGTMRPLLRQTTPARERRGVYGEIISWYETYLATDDAEKNIQLFVELLPDYA